MRGRVAQILETVPTLTWESLTVIKRVTTFPRLRYMGSKYQVIPHLIATFAKLPFVTALDAFSGSGVVAYALKAMGKQVTANDFLNFAATVARATVENPGVLLEPAEIEEILGPPADQRSFIQDTFRGLYFPDDDHAFLDSAWSYIDSMPPYKRDLALASLCLAAARKQPRGVFTVTDLRYDDGRRNLHMPLREQFRLCVDAYNSVVFEGQHPCVARCEDVFSIDPEGYDLVYLDPPYAPPRDDNDYIKRYHFLEGLSVYWRDQEIMENTATKKLRKRYTPFAYKHTVSDALAELFRRFQKSIIVLSYSSNSVPSEEEIFQLLRKTRPAADIKVIAIPHRYHFGTHRTAQRRLVHEYIFVVR